MKALYIKNSVDSLFKRRFRAIVVVIAKLPYESGPTRRGPLTCVLSILRREQCLKIRHSPQAHNVTAYDITFTYLKI